MDEHERDKVPLDHKPEVREKLRLQSGQEDGDEADKRALPCTVEDYGGGWLWVWVGVCVRGNGE